MFVLNPGGGASGGGAGGASSQLRQNLWFFGKLEEEKERERRNRERALEIQRKRKEEQEKKNAEKGAEQEENLKKRQKVEGGIDKNGESHEVLESFEEGASELVTKKEAMKMYCLPEGTLAVCKYVEKENPHNKSWKPMRLYYRSELRKRARERHGGVEGLIAERRKREGKRLEKDLEKTKDIFK